MGTKLRFFARGDALVCVPSSRRIVGTPAVYVGRSRKKTADGVAYPATEQAFECAGPDAARLAKLARRDAALWPADADTAAACGIAFVRLEFADGEWTPAKDRAPSKREKES